MALEETFSPIEFSTITYSYLKMSIVSKKLDKVGSFLETLYRHCLSDGTWFSCPSLQDDNGGNGNRVGWTNYSLCWTETTKKLMEDLNQTPSCPDEASEEAKEVCMK